MRPPHLRRWFDALFGEAFELERRRRRRRYLLAALLIATASAALALGLRDGGRPNSSVAMAGSRLNLTVSSATLHLRGSYHELAAVNGRLVVTSGDVDSEASGCSSTTVDTASLRATYTVRGNCADPALYGRHVLPVGYIASRAGPSGLTLGLRIATLVRTSPAGYTLGPTVFTYSQCSDCGIASIYGDGSLWVYLPYAAGWRRQVGELYRISERTGRVQQRWRMPSFPRVLLAVDRDGLWVAQSLYGGMPSGVPAAQRVDYGSLYRIAPGMRSPQRARVLNGEGAYWMVAARHSVWVDQSDLGRPSLLWRLAGSRATAMISGRREPSGPGCGEMGEGQPSTVGDAQTGIVCIALSESGGKLQEFDPGSGVVHAVPIPALRGNGAYDDGPGPAAVLGHSVFFLEKDRLIRATAR